MKVQQLIAQLSTLPPDADVVAVWDGAARNGINVVWLARSGTVCLGDEGAVVYDTEDRPASAPTTAQDAFWATPYTCCQICGVTLDQPADLLTRSCGGDCVRCMAAAGDPDCVREVELAKDPGWVSIHEYRGPAPLQQGEIGTVVVRPAQSDRTS